MAAGDFSGWPGESNGDPKPKDKQHVPTPDECPLCGQGFGGRYTVHIRTECEGKRHAAGGELVTDGGASAEYKGVHTADESVIEETIAAIETRLDRTTGDCTHFRTGVLINEGEFDVAGQKVSAALRDIASAGEHGRDGIVVERTNPGSQRARWRAWRVPEIATDGGKDTVLACPECDGTDVHSKTGKQLSNVKDADWFCQCGARFDEPARRERRGHGNGVSPHARALLDADPDIVTDGGVGLHDKYEVYKDGERVENCFVLEPEEDLAAQEALIEYATATDDSELREDLWAWLEMLEYPGIATDGGTLVESAGDDPSPTTAVLQVLEDGHSDGVERLDVIERAAALSQTTRDEAEYALEDLRRRGEVYGFDGIVKKTPGGSFEERWGGFS